MMGLQRPCTWTTFAAVVLGILCGRRMDARRFTGLEVKGGVNAEERMAFARGFATPERQAWLAGRVKQQFPELSEKQIGALRLGWQSTDYRSMTGKGTWTRVHVVVSVPTSYGAALEPVLKYCAAEIGAAAASGHRGDVVLGGPLLR